MKGKVIIIAGVLLIAVASIFIFVTADHWWKKVGGAKVSYNGQPSTSVPLYRSPDGRLLIDLRDYQDRLYELHYFEEGRLWLVGSTNQTNFIFLFGYAYSRNIPPPTVDMGGPKIEIDPQIIVGQNSAEFTSAENKRVRIEW
jgi:hypothetical protein